MLLGVICEVKSNQALVRVNYKGTISAFIPYISFANSFKRHFTPPRIGEQVLLLKAENGSFKCAMPAIFNQTCKEPAGNAKKEVIEYEDGTILSYDSSSHTLEILNHATLNIVCSQAVNITTPLTKINGDLVVTGTITDQKGDLTNHSHSDSDGATSLPR